MNRLLTRSFFITLCSAFFCVGTALIAQEIEQVPFPEVVRAEEIVHSEDVADSLTQAINFHEDQYYLQRIHPDGYYHLVATSDNGDVIQLHDASKWSVPYSGRNKVLNWVKNDDLFIKPNAAWFSFHKYVIYNRTMNQVAEVDLINPPLPNGANTFRIVNIEPYKQLVLLSDNTVWQVGSGSNFSYWKIGQRVLVGVNNHWRTTSHPHILINVDQSGDPYCEVSFYGFPVGN